ncbi:MAG: L,D-transpeptidase [Oscillospiraceae bacterium]|jgi:lipoprotein-anchoring transpeptidase ErfK/SrfK|nr:L,D-transpeptidase [Oscillospiraceae bacterium]
MASGKTSSKSKSNSRKKKAAGADKNKHIGIVLSVFLISGILFCYVLPKYSSSFRALTTNVSQTPNSGDSVTEDVGEEEQGQSSSKKDGEGDKTEESKKTSSSTKKTVAAKTEKTTAAKSPAKNVSSKYEITVYVGSQTVGVYRKDDDGKYSILEISFICSTGTVTNPTDYGTYKIMAQYRWRSLMEGSFGQFASEIGNGYLFHSVPGDQKKPNAMSNAGYDRLGTRASHGCIRMCVRDAKWIYDNVPVGTKVKVVTGKGPAGRPIPKRNKAAKYSGWDPTDEWAEGNPYFEDAPAKTTTTTAKTTTAKTTTAKTTASTTSATRQEEGNEGSYLDFAGAVG